MIRPATVIVTTLIGLSAATSAAQGGEGQDELTDRVAALVDEMNSNSAADRRAAEAKLVEMAGATAASAERLLRVLPEASDRMPPAVRSGINRARKRIERKLADSATKASVVTIAAADRPLSEVLQSIGEQSGNMIRNDRDNAEGDAGGARVSLQAESEDFWPVVDRLLDAAGMSVYPYGGAGELALVSRGPNDAKRFGSAAYSGPFRFEPIRVVATRGMRDAGQESLDVDLEVSWEPRLRPISLSQPLGELEVTADNGESLRPARPDQSLDVEVVPGSQAVELRVALALPDRSTRAISSLRGRLLALTPGRIAAFRFDDAGAQASPVTQRQGDATVTLERFFRNNAIWELRMRLKLDRAGDALASHRGWVFQNTSYLETPGGDRFEHAGFETTMQTDSEVGLAYFFDFSDEQAGGEAGFDPKALAWVYETPAGVVQLPIEFELNDIALP